VPVYATPAAVVGLALVPLQTDHRHQIALLAKTRHHLVVDEQAVGEQWKDDLGKLGDDIQNLGPGEGLTPGDENDGHAQIPRLGNDRAQLVRTHLGLTVRALGAGIAALAVQVAAAGDAGDHERRHVHALGGLGLAHRRGLLLGAQGAIEKRRHGRIAQADLQRLAEECVNVVVKEIDVTGVACHACTSSRGSRYGMGRAAMHSIRKARGDGIGRSGGIWIDSWRALALAR
jgi:hypothetical protein